MVKMDEQQPIFISGFELWEWRKNAICDARNAGVPIDEVDWLLRSITDLDALQLRLELFKTRSQIPISKTLVQLNVGWKRRIQERFPVQYIAGSTLWRNFELSVSPAVLIPRPETELIIDLVVKFVIDKPELARGNWVDLGTGSGAIALGIADALKDGLVYAVDYSFDALAIAQKNAVKYQLDQKITFIQGSWWQPLAGRSLQGKIAGMVSNPPYIPTQTVRELDPEVANHEPHLALDGGEDGFKDIRVLIEFAPQFVTPGGLWLIEIMAGQAPDVANLLASNGNYRDIQIHQDLAGIERFVMAELK